MNQAALTLRKTCKKIKIKNKHTGNYNVENVSEMEVGLLLQPVKVLVSVFMSIWRGGTTRGNRHDEAAD